MTGYDTAEGYVNAPLDDRDSDEPEFVVDEELSEMCAPSGGYDPLR